MNVWGISFIIICFVGVMVGLLILDKMERGGK